MSHDEEETPQGFQIALNEANFRTACYGAIIGMLRGLLMAGEHMAESLDPGDPKRERLQNQILELKELQARLELKVPMGTVEHVSKAVFHPLGAEAREKLSKLMEAEAAKEDPDDEGDMEDSPPPPWELDTKH